MDASSLKMVSSEMLTFAAIKANILCGVAEWRNGRRWGLKIPCPQGRVGSTPTSANVLLGG